MLCTVYGNLVQDDSVAAVAILMGVKQQLGTPLHGLTMLFAALEITGVPAATM